MKPFFTFVLISIISANFLFGQNEKFKALYIYNFTKYIEWHNDKQGTFIIGVVGNSELVNELKIIAKKKKINNLEIQVRKYQNLSDLRYCQILYISGSKGVELQKIANKLPQNTLIISDSPGLCKQGAGINFLDYNGSLKYEVNKASILARGLTLNHVLLQLGIEVQ